MFYFIIILFNHKNNNQWSNNPELLYKTNFFIFMNYFILILVKI